MRISIIAAVCISCILLSLLALSSVNSDAIHKTELQESVATAMSQSMQEVMEEESYGMTDEKECISAFMKCLVSKINSEVELQVNVLALDMKEGLLDVEVIAKYKNVKNNDKKVVVRRTVIYEQNSE